MSWLAVVDQVDTWNRPEGRDGFLRHVVKQELHEERVRGDLMHEPVAHQVTQIAQSLMTGVEQPQLHQLVRLHVGNDLHAGVFELRPAVGEVVFEHPLRERLAEYRPLIIEAEPAAERGAIGLGRLRRDAVDHAVGEPDLSGYPVGQLVITQPGEGRERALAYVAVALDVVAGQDAEGGDAAVTATGERFSHQPEHGLRCGHLLDRGLRIVGRTGTRRSTRSRGAPRYHRCAGGPGCTGHPGRPAHRASWRWTAAGRYRRSLSPWRRCTIPVVT